MNDLLVVSCQYALSKRAERESVMISYKVMDVSRNKEIEICLPDPVPLVSPDGALLMLVSLGACFASSVTMFVVPVVAVVGKAAGLMATATLAMVGYVLATEGALAVVTGASAWLHRQVLEAELEWRRKAIEARRLAGGDMA